MTKLGRVFTAIGLALLAPVEASSQDTAVSREPHVRPLSWFESVYVPSLQDRGAGPTAGTSRLTRELRERLVSQGRSWLPDPYSLPFYWTLVDSIGSTAAYTLVATARPDPARRRGIVIEFADTDGDPVAVVHGSTIGSAIGVLNELSGRTTGDRGRSRAPRPVGAYRIMHLSYQSPIGRSDEFDLLPRLMAALRQRGPWELVGALPTESDPRRAETVQCVVWHGRGLPTAVSMRCHALRPGAAGGAALPFDPSQADHVLFLSGRSCKGCFGADFAFTSTRTRAIAAADDLVRDLLEHVELEQRIYAPQRVERAR
jgi:hypothetical protein